MSLISAQGSSAIIYGSIAIIMGKKVALQNVADEGVLGSLKFTQKSKRSIDLD